MQFFYFYFCKNLSVPSANQKFYIQLQSSRLLVHFGQIQEIGHVIDKCLKTASVGIWRGHKSPHTHTETEVKFETK